MTYTRLTVTEELQAWRRMQKAHDRQCVLSFLAGFALAAVMALAFIELTGGF